MNKDIITISFGNILIPDGYTLGECLAYIRRCRNITGQQLGRYYTKWKGWPKNEWSAKKGASIICHWEKGVRTPRIQSQMFLCNHLKITPEEMAEILKRPRYHIIKKIDYENLPPKDIGYLPYYPFAGTTGMLEGTKEAVEGEQLDLI